MQIHDEIVLDVSPDMVEVYLELIDQAFHTAVKLVVPDSPVPFVYEVGTGENWAVKE
jgi:DNA polymerase I-like protein with 3'-5' exonuclease and polymerase domains